MNRIASVFWAIGQRLVPVLVLTNVLLTSAASAQVRRLGPEFQVHSNITAGQYRSSIAYGDGGVLLFNWDSSGHSGPKRATVWGRLFDSVSGFTGPDFYLTTMEDASGLVESAGRATRMPDGRFAFVWQSGEDDYPTVRLKYMSSDVSHSSLSTVVSTSTPATGNYFPRVAAAANGNVMVVWSDNGYWTMENYPYAALASVFDNEGNTITGPFKLTGSARRTFLPDVIATADGSFIATWYGVSASPKTGLDIYARRFSSSGTPSGSKFRINSYRKGAQQRPAIAAAPDGGYLVVWESYFRPEDSYVGIYAQRFDAQDRPTGPEIHVNTFTFGEQVQPAVQSDGVGGFIVLWVSQPPQDGDKCGVFGRRLRGDGSPDGLEFQVNQYTTLDQGWIAWPAGLASQDGELTATWQSDEQDTWGWGVYAQRFRVDPELGPVCGDAHAQDLVLTPADAFEVLRSAVGGRNCLKCLCDVDGSGTITANDSLAVLQAVTAGLDLPACPRCAPGEESPAGAGAIH